MAKGKFVALRHREQTYKGETYESFVGSIKVKGKEILISINAENLEPVVNEGEFKGKQTHTVFANLYEVNPRNKDSRKRNEF